MDLTAMEPGDECELPGPNLEGVPDTSLPSDDDDDDLVPDISDAVED